MSIDNPKPSGNPMTRLCKFVDKNAGILYILPSAIIVIALLGYPLISTIPMSLTNRTMFLPKTRFVGIGNYLRILRDPSFINAIVKSGIWTFYSVTIQIVVGTIVALMLKSIGKFKNLFRSLIIVPWAFPVIVAAFAWLWILNDVYGFVNISLMKIGVLHSPISFFGSARLSMLTVVMLNVWFGFPFITVNTLACLNTIPNDLYESAKIDGANSFRIFIVVTLPHLLPVTMLLISLRTIWVFNEFGRIYLFSGGGPSSATETIPLYVYRMGWISGQIGRASAATLITLIPMIVFFVIYSISMQKAEKKLWQ